MLFPTASSQGSICKFGQNRQLKISKFEQHDERILEKCHKWKRISGLLAVVALFNSAKINIRIPTFKNKMSLLESVFRIYSAPARPICSMPPRADATHHGNGRRDSFRHLLKLAFKDCDNLHREILIYLRQDRCNPAAAVP